MNAVELARVEIQEKDLELVVSEKTLGSLTTNARQIKELVEKALPNYDIANYNEDNIDAAKRDKALLNNSAKVLNAKRLEIEREFMKPFEEFKGVVNDTVKLISECSAKIDTVVKQSEQKYRDEKKSRIEAYFLQKNFTLVPFAKLWDEKYLNKTFKEKEACADIDIKIEKISDDLKTLEAIGEDVDLLKSLYLDTLNINHTIQYANTLKENRERAKREAEARERAKAEAIERERMAAEALKRVEEYASKNNLAFPAADGKKEEKESEEFKESDEKVSQQETESSEPELLTRVFRVVTTRENIIALGDFMNDMGIHFEKIETP